MKSVLVLMSTYNGEKYLREQLDSIFCQKNIEVKVLVRDDGSKDGTTNILDEYSKYNNLSYIKAENINWMHSFWALVNMANGFDYYAFSDQDDIWDADKLLKAVIKLEKYENVPTIYCANQRIVNKNMDILTHTENKVDISNFTILDFLVHGNIFRGCTEVWNNALQQYILSKEIKDIDEPHDSFMMQLALAIGCVIKENEDVMSYRQHENNAIGSKAGIKLAFRKLKNYYEGLFGNVGKKRIYSSRCKKIYDIVKMDLSEEKRDYYEKVCNYDKSFISAFKLAIDKDCKNISIKKRLQIILRKM